MTLTQAGAVNRYAQLLGTDQQLRAAVRELLAGRDLACWCPLSAPCHADVLLAIANPPTYLPDPWEETR
ncbi:DUF4326 domain-containing protein [Luedemannella flava]|uniref:DUF4326 domain-containing protein n=1 Tax=Luedemannella flava TaxID=349316 RepID=UPI0031E04626